MRGEGITMKRILIFIKLFLVIFNLISCRQYSPPDKEIIKIATSIFPIYDITKNIAGDRAEVFFVIPVGANPHTYEPIPSTVKMLKNVSLFIGVHDELDGWIKEYLAEQTMVKFLDEENDKEHEEEMHHDNPHIWLTVKGARKLAEKIAKYLSDIDVKNAHYYNENLHSYLRELDSLDKKIAILFENIENKRFVQWHPAWDFFAEDYGLKIVGSIEKGHGYEPSVKEFKNLVDKARRENAKAIVLGLNVESKATEALAREINGIIVRLDSIGDPKIQGKSNYIRLMYHNAKILSEVLNKQR